uniref:HECT domain-containing protein n=1 Tax=Amphimedon queenslandica TaxID=400682 RepID=A0A1X7U5G7_AMPQE
MRARSTQPKILRHLIPSQGVNDSYHNIKDVKTVLHGVVKTESSEHNITLGDVLAFTTGASSIPPVGFTNRPSIQFHSVSISKFAKANTCGNVLRLSMLTNSYEEFRDVFCFSIASSIGFGKV